MLNLQRDRYYYIQPTSSGINFLEKAERLQMCLYYVCAKWSFALLNWVGIVAVLSERHTKKDSYEQK